MKIKRTIFSILIAFIMLGSLAVIGGCNKEPDEEPYVPKYEYTGGQPVTLYDYLSVSIEVNETNAFLHTSQYANYYFMPNSSVQKRDEFVSSQEKVFELLHEKDYISDDDEFKVYVVDGIENRINRGIISNYDKMSSHSQILLTLQYIYGDFANYGLLFGLSNSLAQEVGFSIDVPSVSDSDAIAFWNNQDNTQLLDFSYPCFVESYSSAQKLEHIKKSAVLLTEYISETQGQSKLDELLGLDYTQVGTPLVQSINSWLAASGSSAQATENRHPIGFAYGGKTCEIRFKTAHADWYLKNDYSEFYLVIYDFDYMKSDYANLVWAIQKLEDELYWIDGILKQDNFYYPPLTVTFEDSEVIRERLGFYGAYYTSLTTNIYTSGLSSMLHEYVHHLTRMYDSQWHHEAIASYFGNYSFFARTTYVKLFEYYKRGGSPNLLVTAVETYLGREYQFDDIETCIHIEIYLNETYELEGSTSANYDARASFSYYISNTYSEEAYILIFTAYRNNTYVAVDKTFEEMYEDWKDWLDDEFGYLKYQLGI